MTRKPRNLALRSGSVGGYTSAGSYVDLGTGSSSRNPETLSMRATLTIHIRDATDFILCCIAMFRYVPKQL